MSSSDSDNPEPDRIWNRGFIALMLIQFAGAINDNILRGAISYAIATDGIWSESAVGRYGGTALAALCLTVPFLLFSGWGGQIADRFSKNRLTMWLKTAELGCALLAMLAFVLGDPNLALATLFLLATQSAFFGPVKYGVITELVGRTRLGPANGWISMSTQIAIVLGAQVAGFVAALYAPDGRVYDMIWLPGLLMAFFAVLGLVPSLLIPRLAPQKSDLTFRINPIATYIDSIRGMTRGPVLRIALAWSGFWLVGAIALVAFPDLQVRLAEPVMAPFLLPSIGICPVVCLVEVPQLDPVRAAALFSTLGISSGIGSAICGQLSRDRIRPDHVPCGALGMTVFFLLFAIAGLLGLRPTPLFWTWMVLAAGAGCSAGFYLIPLMTLIQRRAPDEERGRFLGTTNAISFAFMTFASVLYLIWHKVLGLEPGLVFFLCAGLAAVGCLIFLVRRRRLHEWVDDADIETEGEDGLRDDPRGR